MLVIGAAAEGSSTHVHDVAATHGRPAGGPWTDAVVLVIIDDRHDRPPPSPGIRPTCSSSPSRAAVLSDQILLEGAAHRGG
jgi:hypothetical protein